MTENLLHLLQVMGTTLRLPVSFVVIEFIGTMAFAISVSVWLRPNSSTGSELIS